MNARLVGQDIRRFLLAGNARVTFRNTQTGNRFTYRIRASKDGRVHFVSLLRGTDNDADYSYFGFISRDRFVHGGARAKVGEEAVSVRAFEWIWKRLDELPAAVEVWHEGCCGRCGRALTVPESIASGLGPECASKIARAS